MDDEDLYDEFGNPIGQLLKEENTETAELYEEKVFLDDGDHINERAIEEEQQISTELVHSRLKDAYDNEVEVLVEMEDSQAIDRPLVQPHLERTKGAEYSVFTHLERNLPKTIYERNYMLGMLEAPERTRNIAVIGPLHSGKTSLVDLLVIESHKRLPHLSRNVELGWKQLRYMDNNKLEIERGVTMKLNGITLLSTDLDTKSFAINLIDSPGHVNFMDGTAVSLTASDCAIICIDTVEGVTSVVEKLIEQCQKHALATVFVLNKLDRLILELKLSPMDAYLKLKHIVQQINTFTNSAFSPELNNIVFASTKLGFTFTIQEFVTYYYSSEIPNSKIEGFVKRLWGDIYFEAGSFTDSHQTAKYPTFVEFILLPIYKIFTHTLSDERKVLQQVLERNFSITLDSTYLKYDPLPLLKHVLTRIFKKQAGLIHSLVHCYDPISLASKKLSILLNKKWDDSSCTVLAHAVQNIDYGGSEWSLVRVYRGRIVPGMQLKVIDANSTSSDSGNETAGQDSEKHEYSLANVKEIALLGGRYVFPISQASTGQLLFVKGISDFFTKSATLYVGSDIHPPLFKRIDYINEPVFKVVIEPLVPHELPKLLNGLDKVAKYYPGVVIKVEESGEHVIVGFGELYLDSLLYDLRNNYAGIEIKISSPLTVFSESCSSESFAGIPVKSYNGTTSISIGAEPMNPKLLEDLTKGNITASDLSDRKALAKRLRGDYGWDSLAARNVWSFHNCNALIDDTLPDESDKAVLAGYIQQIRQGFNWATRGGPLADEPIHGVQFKLLEANGLAELGIGGQLIPMVRKACYIALMTAVPLILEPIFEVNVVFKAVLLPIVEELFKKRRGGRIYSCKKIVGTPLSEVRGQLPVIESIGFETDIRLATNGGAMCQLHFWTKIWRRVPGDVMDEDAPIPKLKPAPMNSLSRDFVMKTRRRKGLSNEGFMSNDGPSLEKYIDAEMFTQLKENGLV